MSEKKQPSKKVLQQVADELGMYVYMLVDLVTGCRSTWAKDKD